MTRLRWPTRDRAWPQAQPALEDHALSRLACLALLAVVCVAPLEVELFGLGEILRVTTVELVVAAALVTVGLASWRLRTRLVWPPVAVLLPGGLLLGLLAASALAAPLEQGHALRFTARMVAAVLLFLATALTMTTARRIRTLIATWLATATGVALLAVLEATQVPAVMELLQTFRPGFHVAGSQLRATSTLPYPTIASMYLEVAFALGLFLLVAPSTTHPTRSRVLVFASLTIIGAGIAATFTRAGLIGMAAALSVVAASRARAASRPQADLRLLGALAALLVAIVFLSHSTELLAARLTSEGARGWHGATYVVPDAWQMRPGERQDVPVTVVNTGRLTWDSRAVPPYALSYHWLRAESGEVVEYDGQRTPFRSPVAPGSSVNLPVRVTAPGQPGAYTLVWDVVLESRAWFSTEGVTPATTDVRVDGPPTGSVPTLMSHLPTSAPRPPRPALWAAALRIARDRPWLGVGPDNYRHLYGRHLGLDRWDTRVHANSMYLEVLTGAGLPGLVALVWLLGAVGRTLWRRCWQAPHGRGRLSAALLATWVMVAGHGVVDSFLSFTTTYVVFSMAAGVMFGSAGHSIAGRDANCL
ncbi:MAG: O-antigen ligase family protein [Acidobacteriota bacterium]